MEIFDLGLINFKEAWDFQKEIFSKVKSGQLESALIFCRHNPVITLGRQAERKNILVPLEELKQIGIEVYEVERGGDVTYHGPGQLTVYPIFNLNYLKKDIHFFLRELEEVIIDCLAEYGVLALRRPGFTGVWVGGKKIASIGISIRHWITFHGLSINIKSADLGNFHFIRPCGMDIEMTALESLLGDNIEITNVKQKFRDVFLLNRKSFLCPIGKVSPLGTPLALAERVSLFRREK